MGAATERQILDALGRVADPDKGADIVSLGMVSGLVMVGSILTNKSPVNLDQTAPVEHHVQQAEAADPHAHIVVTGDRMEFPAGAKGMTQRICLDGKVSARAEPRPAAVIVAPRAVKKSRRCMLMTSVSTSWKIRVNDDVPMPEQFGRR